MKLYSIIHCLENIEAEDSAKNGCFDDNDAVIFHNIDTVLGHYAAKLNKTNPFTTWNGASDKGKLVGSTSDPWVDFYSTKVLKMKLGQTDEGEERYRGGMKMKRGHKIATCLLRWARHMQLDSVENDSFKRTSFPLDQSECDGLHFDHEARLREEWKAANLAAPQHNQYIYFVAEVMRLLASRWRECGTRLGSRQSPRRVGRPPNRLSSSGR